MIAHHPAPLLAAALTDGAGLDTWVRHARLWSLVTPPLRPSPDDVAVYQAAVDEWVAASGREDPDVLLLGVTPELCGMTVGARGRVISVDHSADMISGVWPGRHRPHDAVARADWRAMPLARRSIDLVLGDAALCPMKHPEGPAAVCAELRRVMRPSGRWILRCFTRPDETETCDAIFAALDRREIGNVHVLKWRLAMAIQSDTEKGVIARDVWDTLHAEWPDLDALAVAQEWPIDQVRCMEAYRDLDARYTFPTFREQVASLTAGGFDVLRVSTPQYELGDRCPTFVLAARDTLP